MADLKPFFAALGLAFDIEKSTTPSGFKPAEFDLGAGKALFGDVRLLGFAAAMRSGLAKRIIIAGGDEGRYKGEMPVINRAEAIREMLVRESGIAPDHVAAFPSRSNTGGNIAIFAQEIIKSKESQSSFFLMTNLYHLPRAMFDLKAAGLFEVQPIPAEAAILFHDPTAKNELVRLLGEGPLAERIVEEAAGIADKLRGTYKPRTDVQPIALSRPQKV